MLILTCIALCECLNIYHVIILQASCIRCLLKCMSIQLRNCASSIENTSFLLKLMHHLKILVQILFRYNAYIYCKHYRIKNIMAL